MPVLEGHRLAGRVSGDTTVAFAWAWCMAAEGALRHPSVGRAVEDAADAVETWLSRGWERAQTQLHSKDAPPPKPGMNTVPPLVSFTIEGGVNNGPHV